jgi:hypothetical protein
VNLKEAIKDWMDEDGLVVVDYKPSSVCTTGNGLLYTGLYYTQLVKQGLARNDDYDAFVKTVRACEPQISNVRILGVYHRAPCKTEELNSHDDLTGVAVASWAMKAPMATDIFAHGKLTNWGPFRWFYNNLEPGTPTLRTWLGRFQDLVCAIHWSANTT